MGKYYYYVSKSENNTFLTGEETEQTNARKLISNILSGVNVYINENSIIPVIYLSVDLYLIIINNQNFILSDLSNVTVQGKLLGYDVHIDEHLESNQFFLGKEGELNILRRKHKIEKILNRI